MKDYKLRVLWIVFFLLLIFGRCSTPVKKLKQNPEDFAGESVTIHGTIVARRILPLTSYTLYTILDEPFEAYVISSLHPDDRNLFDDDSFTGKVQYAGTEDPVVKEELRRGIQEKLATSSNPLLRARAPEMATVVTEIVDQAGIAGQYPPIVVLLEE